MTNNITEYEDENPPRITPSIPEAMKRLLEHSWGNAHFESEAGSLVEDVAAVLSSHQRLLAALKELTDRLEGAGIVNLTHAKEALTEAEGRGA